jgi:hypothetical protein
MEFGFIPGVPAELYAAELAGQFLPQLGVVGMHTQGNKPATGVYSKLNDYHSIGVLVAKRRWQGQVCP